LSQRHGVSGTKQNLLRQLDDERWCRLSAMLCVASGRLDRGSPGYSRCAEEATCATPRRHRPVRTRATVMIAT
jgi:hypothetical protein